MLGSDKHTANLDSTGLNNLEKTSKSQLMQDIYSKALTLSKIDTNLIIIGESGTGKKRMAHLIHENSVRSKGPFHTYNCMNIDETIYRDAFRERLHVEDEQIVLKYDVIEKAERGILLLNHFSELPPQSMLEMIQLFLKSSRHLFRYEKSAMPRLMLSMKQDEYQKITGNEIWKEILQKIDSVAIILPPLRERQEDIPVYIDFFLEKFKKSNPDWNTLQISDQAVEHCLRYKWPGNIRQLKNALFQGAVFSNGKTIEPGDLPFSMNWSLPYKFDGNKQSDRPK